MTEELKQEDTLKKEAGIRTMKSDIAEYLKETKPSLLSILTREMQQGEFTPEPGRALKTKLRWLPLFGALAALILLAGGGYFAATYFRTEKGGDENIAPHRPIFASEKTKIILARDTDDIMRNLQLLGEESERDGIVTKLDMRLRETGNAVTFTPETFLKAIGAKPPAEFYQNHERAFYPFMHSDRGIPRFGMLLVSRNSVRSLQQMLAWEAAIQRDLEPLFLGRLPESAVGAFTDKQYRNINYRFLPLSRSEDFGIGYFVFSAKQYLVVATSEKTVETAINRLFEAN